MAFKLFKRSCSPQSHPVLDQREFVFPKGGIASPLPGEINNRSHASTQTVAGDLTAESGAGDGRTRTQQDNPGQAIHAKNDVICTTCQARGHATKTNEWLAAVTTTPKSIMNGSIPNKDDPATCRIPKTLPLTLRSTPAPVIDPLITSTTERRWYNNFLVRNNNNWISPVDLSATANYIFGNKLLQGQVIAFRVTGINPGARGSIAFGFTTKSKHVFSSLPANVKDLLANAVTPRSWYVVPDLLTTSFSFEDVFSIKRVSRSIVFPDRERAFKEHLHAGRGCKDLSLLLLQRMYQWDSGDGRHDS